MPKILTQEWLDLQRELSESFPEKPGATAVMQYKVTGGPDGDVVFNTVIENGKMQSNTLGAADEPSFTMTVGYDDFVKITKGDLDANAAFMQGRVKAEGDIGKLMSLMPLTQSTEYKDIQAEVAEKTEY